jgi:excisionase family DNA binding protein
VSLPSKSSGSGQSVVVAVKKSSEPGGLQTLTVPDVAELLGVQVTKVRRLIEDRHLLATRVDGVLRIPVDFFRDGHVLSELHGTFVLLHDVGFSDTEIFDWMFTQEESLKATPIEALRAGRKAEVRRVAQALL